MVEISQKSLDWSRENIRQKYENNKSIKFSKTESTYIEQKGIKFLVRLLIVDKIEEKGKFQTLTDPKSAKKSDSNNNFDPFQHPYIEEDLLIEDNFTESHRAVFNKFPISRYHVVLATREFANQYTHLSVGDIESVLLMMKVVNGFGFFNGGLKAGASQKHKHLQVLKYDDEQNYGIFKLSKNIENFSEISEINYDQQSYLKINAFNFEHIFVKFNEVTQNEIKNIDFNNSNLIASKISKIVNFCLNFLKLKGTEDEIHCDYSFLISDEFFIITPRKSPEILMKNGIINVNSAGLTLSFLVKSNELYDELSSSEIVSLYNQIFGY